MWKGRFQQETHSLVLRYSESISYDWRLFRHDIQGSIAHATALQKQELITFEELGQIKDGLLGIRDDIEAGNFKFDPKLEDIHMNIESALSKRIGEAGGKLHTARSRNDQVALDLRLYLREETTEIQKLLRALQLSLVSTGEKFVHIIMPAYTHLQRGQPTLFAHHLLAYVEMFQRDLDRLEDSRKRINVMPLGSGALAGSTINLDRHLIAELLNFPRITQNSMDAVSDRDFVIEMLSTLAMVGMHLSRLSEDLILWSSSEFKFITLSDAFTTGSSLMPQKKNPDVAELARGKTGRLFGNLMSMLTTMKGLPLTYNRDMQEDKEAIFDSIDTVKMSLEVFTAMLPEMKVNENRIERAVNDAGLLATDLADYLVLKGVPFRSAHEVIGKLVALCVEKDTGFLDLTLEDYRAVSSAFENDVYEVLNLERSVEKRTNPGAPSPKNVAQQIAGWKEILGDR